MAITSTTTTAILMQAAHALRYEITFLLVLAGFWFVGRFASSRSKPARSGKMADKSSGKQPSPNAAAGKAVPPQQPSASVRKNSGPDSPPKAPVVHLGPIKTIDPKLLCDPSWLVPQAIFMCRGQLQYSMALYHAALHAGLKLQDLPEQDCKELFTALVTAAIRTNQMDEAIKLLQDLRELGPGVYAELFCSVVKLCTSKHLFAESLAVYDFMGEDPKFTSLDRSVWSCLLFCALEVKACGRCGFFMDRIKASDEKPSQKDYGNMVRVAALQGDWQLSLQLVQEMQEAGVEADSVIYNTALATCVAAGKVDQARALLQDMEHTNALVDVVTYNTVMKGYAKAGLMNKCMDVFELLKRQKVTPSQVTYGILLDGFINENQLERAAEIFSTMSSEGCTMNTVLYTTLIKGFARSGEVKQAMGVYEQMAEHNVTPDIITFSILIKANCDADQLEEALKLLEAMTSFNLRPDEVVFNSLLTGCALATNLKLGQALYADMVSYGIRPSNATFSIMIRVFHQCKVLEEAVEMLTNEPAKHKVDAEPRLYLQLIQACIRERQGRRAVDVYKLLMERSVPTAATHGAMVTTCLKLNMFDTAAEVLSIAAEKGFRVDARDANALLNGAARKRKAQIARDVADSMAKLGLAVADSQLQAALGN